MEDFEIDIISDNTSNSTPIRLPLNFLNIGEIENDDVKVYIHQDVYKKMEKYASSDTAHELGTIMIGEYSEDMGKMHVVISEFIYAKYTDASASTLTFTHETWDYVHREHDEKFPDKKIIGWQHTHPGYGIFLSNYDMFIQENFFNLPFQVAYVIDPVQHLRGFFQWKNGKVEKLKGFYIYDDVGKQIKIEQPKMKNNVDKKDVVPLKTSKVQPILIGLLVVFTIMLLFTTTSLQKKLVARSEEQVALTNKIEEQNVFIAEQAEEIASIKDSVDNLLSFTENEFGQIEENTEDNNEQDVKPVDKTEISSGEQTEQKTETIENQVVLTAYTVQPGDSLSAICKANHIDYVANYRIILSMNGIEDANQLYVGQTILLPISR